MKICCKYWEYLQQTELNSTPLYTTSESTAYLIILVDYMK